MKGLTEIMATFIVVLLVVWYALMGGVTAGWYARLIDDPRDGGAASVGIFWPVTAPFLLGVQVYKTMEEER